MSVTIYIEGAASGPDSKYLQVRCREGFHRLFEKCGLPRKPALKASGSRGNTYKDFSKAHAKSGNGDFVAMLVDSEEVVEDIEKPWHHLKKLDNWNTPAGATDEQVLLMVTCMESWIASDRQALREHFGAKLQEGALPFLQNMEKRGRHDVQNALEHSTRNCKNGYKKGKRSFEVLKRIRPEELRKHLPSFERCERVLRKKL